MRIAMIAFTNIEYTIELTEGLNKERDVDIILLIPRSQANRFRRIICKKVKVNDFYYPRIRHVSNIFMIMELVKILEKFNPSIIHVQKGHPWFNFILPILKMKYCLVTTIHDVILLDWPSQRIPEFTYLPPIKYGTKLIVHGEYLKKKMIEKYKRNSNDICILPRGVNSIYKRFVDKCINEDIYSVMFFGRIWPYKGLEYLIKAEPLVTEVIPKARFIIAGEGENFNRYRSIMIHENRFSVYNEFISNNRTAELFQEAGIVVLPYIDGSQSGVIPQAYAFAKPVITTNVGSLPENVDDGKTGIVVPAKNVKALAEAIIFLMKNQEKRRWMGENAFRKTENELSWKNIARQTIEVYKKALSANIKCSKMI
jgi:glycosyltransferase involved in cell wall biosynthesis